MSPNKKTHGHQWKRFNKNITAESDEAFTFRYQQTQDTRATQICQNNTMKIWSAKSKLGKSKEKWQCFTNKQISKKKENRERWSKISIIKRDKTFQIKCNVNTLFV